MKTGLLFLALLAALIPNSVLAAPDPNANPPAGDPVLSNPVSNGFGNAAPVVPITPNNFCHEIARDGAYSCVIPGVAITNLQRYSQITEGAGNPVRETLEIQANNNNIKIRIHAGENGSPILESCERMAIKSFQSSGPPIYFGIEFKYPKTAPSLASRIGKNNEVDIVLDPSQGPALSLRCFFAFINLAPN